ncbi:chemotaxis protein CheC [Arcobacter roscoffensis]|uniref:Chemotaxis protein CheC n=1 Tax=Arcobacter roscoffensis TaxID=2961520 RepID=A0ABY5E5R1_9BACT|nr:chemotaxis protein CheC [Arcobacter roscoffensis]UTJ07080.1 chemotaxis protein CheC [Arcobacter roscoffensis]
MNSISLNEDEKDCLQELMNIAYGSASSAIADIIDAFATLAIPNINIINVSELKPYLDKQLKNQEHFVSSQLINGDFQGENLFIIDRPSALNLSEEFDLINDENLSDEEICDIILEITNILSSTTISSLIKEMNSYASFSPPSITLINSASQLEDNLIEQYQQVIIISTELNFSEQNIYGHLLMLATDESILHIKRTINKILDEY